MQNVVTCCAAQHWVIMYEHSHVKPSEILQL